ncbi:unnamed protein product [Alopecurus aequalis]
MTRMDDDVERPTPHGDMAETALDDKAKLRKALCITSLISLAFTACIMILLWYFVMVNAHYSVAIDSASDLKTGVLFNLTLGVASRSHGAEACIDPGMFVEVFYRGVQVAASDAAETRQTCARPRNMAELPVVAKATRMLVGGVLDSLAAEMAQGAAVFDLRLHGPTCTHLRRSGWISDCKGSRVGEAAVACHSPTYYDRVVAN